MERESDAILSETQKIRHVLTSACTSDPTLREKIEDAADKFAFEDKSIPIGLRPLVRGFMALEYTKEAGKKTHDCLEEVAALERQNVLKEILSRHAELGKKVSTWFAQNKPA